LFGEGIDCLGEVMEASSRSRTSPYSTSISWLPMMPQRVLAELRKA